MTLARSRSSISRHPRIPQVVSALRRTTDRGARSCSTARATLTEMDDVRLGKTGLPVSELCLGTMTFGLQCDEETRYPSWIAPPRAGSLHRHRRRLSPRRRPADGGPNRGDRRTLAQASATGSSSPPSASGTWARRLGPGEVAKHILDAIDASLRRLGTDYVDLYQLHGADPATPIDETLGALDDVVRSARRATSVAPTCWPIRCARPSAEARAGPGPLRLGAAPLQPALPPDRARALPVRGGGDRRHPLQPARRRPALRQAQPAEPPAEGTRFTSARAGGLPGALLARARIRDRRGARAIAVREASRSSRSRWRGCWPIPP